MFEQEVQLQLNQQRQRLFEQRLLARKQTFVDVSNNQRQHQPQSPPQSHPFLRTYYKHNDLYRQNLLKSKTEHHRQHQQFEYQRQDTDTSRNYSIASTRHLQAPSQSLIPPTTTTTTTSTILPPSSNNNQFYQYAKRTNAHVSDCVNNDRHFIKNSNQCDESNNHNSNNYLRTNNNLFTKVPYCKNVNGIIKTDTYIENLKTPIKMHQQDFIIEHSQLVIQRDGNKTTETTNAVQQSDHYTQVEKNEPVEYIKFQRKF